jgi:hypothetical protein
VQPLLQHYVASGQAPVEVTEGNLEAQVEGGVLKGGAGLGGATLGHPSSSSSSSRSSTWAQNADRVGMREQMLRAYLGRI